MQFKKKSAFKEWDEATSKLQKKGPAAIYLLRAAAVENPDDMGEFANLVLLDMNEEETLPILQETVLLANPEAKKWGFRCLGGIG